MKLLVITQTVNKDDSNLGFFCAWIREFGAQVEKVEVLCSSKGEYDLPSNVRVFSMGKEQGLGRLRRYLNFSAGGGSAFGGKMYLLRTLWKSDAIFVHMIPFWVILVWPLAFLLRKKIYLWYTHGSVSISLRVAEKLVAKIFTASEASCRLQSAKIVVVGHGIDIDLFGHEKVEFPSGIKLLSVSRIAPSKDLGILILAVAELVARGFKNVTLDIVGSPILEKDKIYFQELQNLIKEKKLETQVNFWGARSYSEMPLIYGGHNIFLHASKTGSLDKAVLEALASGLQVLTSSKVYGEYVNALAKFQAGDPQDLAMKIISLVSHGAIKYNSLGVQLVKEKASISSVISGVTSMIRAGL